MRASRAKETRVAWTASRQRVFVDTNVFVYADDRSAPSKRLRARRALAQLMGERRATVSTQVMQEYFVTATKKLGLSVPRVRARIQGMQRLGVVTLDPELVLGAIDLHLGYALSFWDALLVKAASASGCTTLLTEDLQHGRVIDGVRIASPFV